MARTAIVLIVALATIFVLVRLLEPRFAFFPFPGETTTPREFGIDYEALTISTRDGERLRAWHLRPALSERSESNGPAQRALIVYFHGNGANLSNWAPILVGIARQGYSVLAVDYRGYGLSTGRPSERGLQRDVDAVIDFVWNGSDSTDTGSSGAARGRVAPLAERAGAGRGASATNLATIYWGRSIGAAMAAYAAARRAPAGLILESGFPDARSLFRASPVMAFLAIFSTYRFSAADALERVTAPVLVLHGDADSIIPFEQGRALFERITGPKQFFVIRGGDHNDAAPQDEEAYWKAINGFVDSVVRAS